MKISAKSALKMILLSVMLCFGVAVVGNLDMAKRAVEACTPVQQEDRPIERFRTERQQLRAMQKAQLNDIIHDASTDTETADMARRQLLTLCDAEEKELTIEGVLAMRGFQNPVVTVHAGSVNVIIEAELVTRQESSVILDFVCRETGAMAGDIKIIPIN